jgi:hypothetical protein
MIDSILRLGWFQLRRSSGIAAALSHQMLHETYSVTRPDAVSQRPFRRCLECFRQSGSSKPNACKVATRNSLAHAAKSRTMSANMLDGVPLVGVT